MKDQLEQSHRETDFKELNKIKDLSLKDPRRAKKRIKEKIILCHTKMTCLNIKDREILKVDRRKDHI